MGSAKGLLMFQKFRDLKKVKNHSSIQFKYFCYSDEVIFWNLIQIHERPLKSHHNECTVLPFCAILE